MTIEASEDRSCRITVGVSPSGGVVITMVHGPVLASVIFDPDEETDFLLARVAEVRAEAREVKARRGNESTPAPLGVVKVAPSVN